MRMIATAVLSSAVLLAAPLAALAQQTTVTPPQDPAAAGGPAPVINNPPPATAGDTSQPAGKLVLLFDTGVYRLSSENEAILDQASRLYREGRPIIMTVSGATDSVGAPLSNLVLSQQRANAVAMGMRERGIPAGRTQILAKGETSPAVNVPPGTPERQNRRVEITWQ